MVNPLSRVGMKNVVKDSNPIISARVYGKGTNLNNDENEIILGIIKGEREVAERKTINTAISLKEAANRIKNNR